VIFGLTDLAPANLRLNRWICRSLLCQSLSAFIMSHVQFVGGSLYYTPAVSLIIWQFRLRMSCPSDPRRPSPQWDQAWGSGIQLVNTSHSDIGNLVQGKSWWSCRRGAADRLRCDGWRSADSAPVSGSASSKSCCCRGAYYAWNRNRSSLHTVSNHGLLIVLPGAVPCLNPVPVGWFGCWSGEKNVLCNIHWSMR
jgi:hypothetical protein